MPIQVFTEQESLVSVLPFHILANGRFSNLPLLLSYGRQFSTRAAQTWPSGNRAVYCPVSLPSAFTVSRFFLGNGNTTGNVDIGLYDTNGKLLLNTTSTGRLGAATVQYISVTAQAFPAGFYYLALVCASGSGTVDGVNTDSVNSFTLYTQAAGLLQEALGATALPSTMTPVEYTSTLSFNFGFTQSATL